METFLEILKFTIPSLITFGVAYLILSKFMEDQNQKRMYEFKQESHKLVTPIRLQAYERITLFLERVAPISLIPRLHKPGMSAKMLQQHMIKSIRSEYEHNIAQQIYVTPAIWKLVGQSKEELIRIVNIAATKVEPEADAITLTKTIYAMLQEIGGSPTDKALGALKQEIFKQFK